MTAQSSGLRPPEQTTPQDWGRLSRWLAGHGHDLDLDVDPRQFSGGLANLNYLITVDRTPVVLRRPPAGPVAEGANDMAREWQVLSRLAEHYALAPRGVLFCDDSAVLGAPFQLIEYRAGIAIGAHLPPSMAARTDAPALLTAGLVHALGTLHAVDPEAAGLGSLGKPAGFLGRQVEGWARRADAAYQAATPDSVTRILLWLRAHVPAEPELPSLIHCDLKLDNVLVDPVTLAAVAVVDWDMTTRGDPLFDLGVLLSYWIDPEDPTALHALDQVPSLEPGFPRRREVAAQYFRATGRPSADLSFHVTLARLRLAIAWQQLYRLFRSGGLTDPKYARLPAIALDILSWTADTLDNPPL